MSTLTTPRRVGVLGASFAMALVVAGLWVLEAIDQASGDHQELAPTPPPHVDDRTPTPSG